MVDFQTVNYENKYNGLNPPIKKYRQLDESQKAMFNYMLSIRDILNEKK